MGELDLEPPLRRRRPLPEDFEDEPRAVDHLGLGRGFQILLLDGGDRSVDDDQLRLVAGDRLRDRLDLARAEQGRGPGRADPEMEPVGHLDSDRLGESGRLLEASVDVAPSPPPAHVGESDDRLGAPGKLAVIRLLENAQAAGSSSSCSMKLTGRSGCTVEMACL